jgi:type II restriction/modification system DNA methylase subunit YeeA
MDAAEFVSKWSKASNLGERSAAQQHYLDLCELFDIPKPAAADPDGAWHTFEKGVRKLGGRRGFADVWMKDRFAWEYKKKHKDLDAAFNQLLQYVGDLDNPPLLVACDLHRIVIRRHFTGYPADPIEIPLEKFDHPKSLDILGKLFRDPEALKPAKTTADITDEAARDFAVVAPDIRARCKDATQAAHFLDRLVFCMFAEDANLLPGAIFSRIVARPNRDPRAISRDIGQLFEAMAAGGSFWGEEVPHFNGTLFDDRPVVELRGAEFEVIKKAAARDWSQMDVSIFGTLFERVMDESQRKQLGAHYTGFDDIRSLVEPVVLVPLRREWNAARERAESLLAGADASDPHPGPLGEGRGEGLPHSIPSARPPARAAAQAAVEAFLARLRSVRVLDPACGSGNFLYVALKLMKDLEKQVQVFCRTHGLEASPPAVGPHQLFGIEVNEYAYDLAQMTVWIGWLQWHRDNGFPITDRPILRALDNIRLMDAILDTSDPDHPREPDWPAADFIVGNPPFLGGKLLRRELGDDYVNKLFHYWRDRVRPEADLCCYWFEKARAHIEQGKCSRAGLLATQGIRGGANRETLKRIKQTGDIFFGVSDRNWVIAGANVHISIIGFDNGDETVKMLDGALADDINANLSAAEADITSARRLAQNANIGFMGDTKGGPFDIVERIAIHFNDQPNPHGKPNSDVVVPWVNGKCITNRKFDVWIIDFNASSSLVEASLYEAPFQFLAEHQKDKRAQSRSIIKKWWLHERPRIDMRNRLVGLDRFIITNTTSKHRMFAWIKSPTLPDHQLIVFARSDDYFFGVLHSRFHELWARAQGTQVRERESGFRYTPTTCFETFPFPEPTPSQAEAIGATAKRLDDLRNGWLNPPEWTRTEVLEFPGSASGPWARYVHEPDARGIGTVRYPRVVPKDDDCALRLAKRTLTALYNTRPTWLDQAHRALDAAVAAAYGWPADLSDDAVLSRLLALNLARADAASGSS